LVRKDPKCWVFGEWLGERCGDSSLFFANYVANRNTDLNLYWICKKNTDTSMLDSRVKVLELGSSEAEKILRHAGAIFVDHGVYDVSPCRYNIYGRAVTVNFWHGFALKRIGHDEYKQTLIFRMYCKLLDPVLNPRYFVTLSDEYSKTLKTAFGLKPKSLIKAGYPRNSIFYSQTKLREAREILLKMIPSDVNADGLKIAVYMPTWRDNKDEIPNLAKIFSDDFTKWLEDNNVIIIHKAHFADSDRVEQNSRRVININNISASILMAGSDMLISDYSSCVFDYLILDRPIIHFAYDYERYTTINRALYYEWNEAACGTVAETVEELQQAIKAGIISPDSQKELRHQRREKLMTYEGPDSCENIFNFVCERLEEMKA
ncbi:MAG: CDP-glycerol glycerophosphotransferase family protein, partial [Synergistaceae bacterium]|nr:CDP-glycerol glycerophosphotransferase family protein [Synergistaceae bacterium]